MARIVATPADVRSFAAKKNIPVTSTGRLSAELIEAFNTGQKTHTYSIGVRPVQTVKVTGRRKLDNGKTIPVTKNISTAMVRAAAADAGVSLGRRGRVSSAAVQATISGDWSAFLTPTAGDLAAGMVE